jgi:hypothetical protein
MTAPADFRHDLVRGPVRMNADGDLVFFDNTEPVPASKERNGADADRGSSENGAKGKTSSKPSISLVVRDLMFQPSGNSKSTHQITPDLWHALVLKLRGTELQVMLNGELALTYTTLCGDVPKNDMGL